jgi:DNA-directed RNA polymerase II subunit RPB2
MDIARHVVECFFRDTPNPLVRHHLDSFADMLTTKIPNFVRGSNPLRLVIDDARTIDVYVGGRNGSAITYSPPTDEDSAVLPHTCRLENKTYALNVHATLEIDYVIPGKTITKTFEVLLGRIPLMVKSSLCALSTMKLEDAGECAYELGGYFIINGAEKVLLSQERLGDNIPYATKRIQTPAADEMRGLSEKEVNTKIEGAKKEGKHEYIAGIRSISADGTRGPYSHFLVIPPANKKPNTAKASDWAEYSTKRLAVITLPGFTRPVPLLSVFRALGISNDADVYDTILAGVHETDRPAYDNLFTELVMSHETYIAQEMKKEEDDTQDPDLLFLRRQTRTRSVGAVYVNIKTFMFPHCEEKAYMLGTMVRMAMDVAIGKAGKSDRDHFRFKRLDASGDLCFQLFRKVYKEIGKEMLTKMDTRIHFEPQTYAGEKIANVVLPETLKAYWDAYALLNTFEKSFKGQWMQKDGVAQELSRLAYLGTIAHLRRVNLQMDKSTPAVEPRRIHSSTWGIMCPADNPDGGNIGMIKSLTLFCTLSTASPAADVIAVFKSRPEFTPVRLLHPSTWNPAWTPVIVNAELVGVLESNTEAIHAFVLGKRRDGTIHKFVSLSWNRLQNEYRVYTDAGRPCRPVYREHVHAEDIARSKTWAEIEGYLDYIDAQETESMRISMQSFANIPSEIHGSMMFSASASIIPNADFNQAPRNFFSCQQTKQACSRFSTAFSKRFDTIATLLNYAQRPLSQTWMGSPIVGNMPYGENAIVALMIYTGHNQEDSLLLNDSALRRGMFHTTYYHSYDFTEEMIGETHTIFANVATDPAYRESVTLRKDYGYDKLDGEGIVKVGAVVDDETILVGVVSPRTDGGYTDASCIPKRGQRGRVDAVYRYVTPDGLRGVKIRVAEQRIPVLGDKFSARHGQKGTVGMRVPEEDMPFTKAGLRPDMIVNPHAFPSRMTIGQFVEMMATKLGIHMGSLVDSTPFTARNRVQELSDLLRKAGFHSYGHEVMYNGHTGEQVPMEVFMGPTYYLRLKHMVEDKINYTTRGPRKLLTHQPVEGRSNDGGLRIGEMERDALLSLGMSKFVHESLMDRSDGADVMFDPEHGTLDARADTRSKLTMPYATNLFIKELEAMHISVKLAS